MCVCVCVYACAGTHTHMLRCSQLSYTMDCSQPGSSAHGILQARILVWVAMPSFRGSFQPRDWTSVSCIDRWILYHWATCKAPKFLLSVGLFCIQSPDKPEKAMAPHSSTLAWKIPWTEEPGRLQSMGSLRVRHDWVTSLSRFTFMHWRRKWWPTPVFLPGESQGRRSLVGCRLWGHTESNMTEVT